MKRCGLGILLFLLPYLLTGFYIVRGNEKGVVQRFGKVRMSPLGTVDLIDSGLHYDLPWPFSTVTRINLNEVRTLTIGLTESENVNVEESSFLTGVDDVAGSQFLTGDKNILNLQISVQYRISELKAYNYLFGSESPEEHLRLLVESNSTDLISRSGVDFVHPLGLGRLRELLTTQVRQLTQQHRLGIEVEEVTISAVYPPVRVKADFVEVSNARADRERYIYAANAYAVQSREEARARSQQILDEAAIFRGQRVEAAKGSAYSFNQIVKQFSETSSQDATVRRTARRIAMQRLYLDAMEDILRKVKSKVLLESGKPVDLTIFQRSQP
ncbi:MAG: protease modulator HflK [Planctomycetes bacterium]|nr:protease modulator HflK [Planctomycetota bacterium]